MIIEEAVEEAVKEKFSQIHSNKEDIADLNQANTGMFDALAEMLRCDKPSIRAAYSYWELKYDDPDNEKLDNVNQIVEIVSEG